MTERLPHAQSSCPGVTRASPTFAASKEDVDSRDKPGHDARGGRLRKIAIRGAAALAIAVIAFACWVISLGPLPLDEAKRVSASVVDRNGKLLRAYAMADG